jgi:uncharacterized protein (DUF1330 family)
MMARMSAYVVANYQVTNPAGYAAYRLAARASILAHGGEILVADFTTEALEGSPHPVTVVIRFPDREAARAWYTSPDYQRIQQLRVENSEGSLGLVDGFALPH